MPFVQVCCVGVLIAVKTIKSIAIVFPLMVLAMCFIRKVNRTNYIFTNMTCLLLCAQVCVCIFILRRFHFPSGGTKSEGRGDRYILKTEQREPFH